jgi:hypothetical protein
LKPRQWLYRRIAWSGVFALSMATLYPVTVGAAQITSRKLTLGSSAVTTSTTHKYDFTVPSVGNTNIGSIKFLYCTTASGACTTPSGLVTTSATLSAQGGATGFTINNGTAGAPYITRTAASVTAGTALTYTLSSVTNPSTTNTTFYVRITSYSDNAITTAVDSGVVAASTATQIVVSAQVDEILIFCVYTGANCAAGGSTVDLGNLTPSTTGVGASFLDAGTNAASGFVVQYNAPSLTSGGNSISAIGGTSTASVVGTAQFGINSTGPNTTPAVTGSQAPSGTAPIGQASTNYNTPDQYAFLASTPTTLANSTGPANVTKYSVSYLANVNASQPAGAYTSTFTYICTATY